MSKVLLSSEERQQRARSGIEPALPWGIALGVGFAIAIVGWTDLTLLWYPLQFGNPEWEFGTISAHLDGMPLGTLGLATFAAGAVGLGWRRTTRVVAVVCLLVMLLILGIGVIYLLVVPVALQGAPPAVKPGLVKAMVKAGVFAATYAVLYGWLGWFLLRRPRPSTA
jgi:hypothetical protein